jgi:hypothetical protein
MLNRLRIAAVGSVLAACWLCAAQSVPPAPRVIELTADKDSRYRQGDKVAPTIEVSPGEHLILRITAIKARQLARDGSVHGLALLDKDENAVPGWRFYFHAGVQEVEVTAPSQPGRYTAVCIVICSDMHEDMGFTLVVSPPVSSAKE